MIHILERLLNDPLFAAILSPIPLDRINIHHGDIKRCAINVVMAMYRLTGLSPGEIKVRIEELLKHRYIFPVNATGQMQLSLPFHHAAIKHVIREQMMTSSIFKGRNYECLPTRHPKHPDIREIYHLTQQILVCELLVNKLFGAFSGQTRLLAVLTPCSTAGEDAAKEIVSYTQTNAQIVTVGAVIG
ncbi:hypothetical protein B0H13DRAFT_2333577 [Mycena leptocephala]|nr:hypothetical protein B0H13DRAFT_2333577 [Mycena leptocephala]